MLENKKIPLMIASAVIGIIIVIALFQNKSGNKISTAIDAVPLNAAVIFETKDAGELLNILKSNEGIIAGLEKSNSFNSYSGKFLELFDLFEKNSEIRAFLKNRSFVISLHQSQEFEVSKLFVSSADKKEFNKLEKSLKKIYSGAKKSTIKYGDAEIYNYKFPETPEESFSFTHYDKYFLLGSSEIVIEKSIRKIQTAGSFIDDQKFHEVSELTNDARHRLFINYERLPLVLSKLLKHNKSTIEFISKFADWSALELEMDDNEIELSGYTNSGENHKYLNVFKKQRPDDNNLLSLLPNNISSFMILNIGEGNEFKKHYENYLSDLNDIKDYKKNLKIWYNKNIGSQTTIDFFDFTTGEIALVYKQPGFAATSHQIVFTEVSNKKKAIDFFRAHIQKIDTVSKTIKVAGQRYILYPFQSEQFFAHAFGSVFSNVSPTTVCLIENYLVFSESEKAFKNFIIDYHKKGKLKEAEHLQFYTNESNIFIYSNVLRSIPFLNNYLLEKTSDKLKKDKNFWRNISGPGIQFTADSNPVYTAIKIQLKSVTNKNIQAEWECTLDSKPITKPFTVKNHNTGDYEIFVQTESNTIYLISSKGEILWKKIVNGKIISEVFQIDYYKNNKLQLLFNTAKTLYLIDREGNKTDNYPIDFKSPATNGITVIDYDKDKNYRIFFANKNKGVYALDKTGSTLNGWVFDKTQQEVTRPIQYFRNETKDYICFFDQSKLYITNRRGEIRLKPQADFPIAKNTALFFEPKTKTSSPRFVLSDPSGSVYFVYLDSGNVKRMKMKAKSGNHWFNYKDVSGNSYPEFIFTDENKLTVTDRTNKQVFEMKLEKPISQEMNHYQFSNKNHQIGVVTQANNKVYLIKNNGKPGEGFPLAGNTPFSVRRFNNNQHFSLVVGSNNKLLSYRIYR